MQSLETYNRDITSTNLSLPCVPTVHSVQVDLGLRTVQVGPLDQGQVDQEYRWVQCHPCHQMPPGYQGVH